ncbi:MAG TPA: hypothetical protein VH083_06445 [Myxococcales bacterium]|jgi:hypothetical protein|nr:hypothetical protein [Myxococcales bacterium]
MKKILIGCCLLLCAAACMRRVTRFRNNFKDCVATSDGAISCQGVPSAQVECFLPRSNSCRALALKYADGERVWLYEPMKFDPDNPQAEVNEDDPVVLQPEIAKDASMVWFRRSNAYPGTWETFEPLTGVFDQAEARTIMLMRQRTDAISLIPLAK